MKFFKASSLIALAAMSMTAAPAMAASFAGPATVVATGHITATAPFNSYDCVITINFGVASTAMTSSGGTAAADSHGTVSPCSSASGTFNVFIARPITAPVGATAGQIKVDDIIFDAPFGICERSDVTFAWKNTAPQIQVTTAIPVGLCRINTMNLSATGVTVI